jgi:hypothetical protein
MAKRECRCDPPIWWGGDFWTCSKCRSRWDLRASRAILREQNKSKILEWLRS